MKTNTNQIQLLAALALASAALVFTACSPKADSPAETSEAATDTSIPMLDTKPAGALPVKAARLQLKPGDEAVVYGQIGGVLKPFYEGSTGFVLADTELVFCNEMGEDEHCATPWDACCEETELLKASRVSVQLVDADGIPYAYGLKGKAGFEELAEVVVTGTVASSSTADNLIINAAGFYLEP